MEILSGFSTVDEHMELPPGFRFHPTDEELIIHYLSPKVLDSSFNTKVVGDVDLNKVEPWDLPWMAKMGEKEWYFFCLRDRKYPTGLRTNRATDAGYWKATGKDKEIYHAKTLVGMKKTLVFYRGRAPRGEKSNWVMHEYILEGKNYMHHPPKTSKNEWVICRIFKKCSGGKKVHISGLEKRSCDLPPLMDLSSDENLTRNTSTTAAEGSHVTCFSNSKENPQDKSVQELSSSSSKNRDFSPFSYNFPNISNTNSIFSSQNIPCTENLHYTDSVSMQDQSILRLLLENNGAKTKEVAKPEFSQGMNVSMSSQMEMNDRLDQEFPVICTGQVDLDCLWNY